MSKKRAVHFNGGEPGRDPFRPPQDNHGESFLATWFNRAASMPPAALYAVTVVLVTLVGALDTVTGPEISFSVFYLVPVAFAGGLLSRRAGRVTAALSAVVWGFLEVRYGNRYSASWIPYWNSLVRLGFFLIVNELIEGLKIAHERERSLSRTDSLTGVANNRVFVEYTTRTIAESGRSGRHFTIAYIDLDRFKQVNDRLGHSEGDRLLREVARVISEGLRTSDTVARLGGDEFGILMPDTGVKQARVSLERIAVSLTRDVASRWPIGATLGAVTFTEPPQDADSAVRLADTLMYEGKAAGRGRIVQGTWPETDVKR